jgi:PAS domain S-box-containing protein
MLGYSEEEILRLGVDDIHPKEDLPSVYDAFETMLWKEAPISPSLPLKRKDNTIFQAEVSATPIVLAGKDCLVGCFRDITNRRQMEAEQKRLATAIEQAAEMIIVTDATPAIQYVNPAFEATTGYTRAEVLGQNPRFLKSGKQDDLFYQELWSTISNGRTWHGRFVNKKKDGNYYTEEATISPVRDVSGRISNYVAVQRDVTRELEIQAQLHAAQKMESVGRLAGGVAHDFNNLLSVIISYAGLAADELRESDPIRADIVEIQNAGERAAALTRRLLAFSRRQLLEPEVLCLNNVVSGIENMLHRLLGEDIDIKVHLADGLGSVMADPGQLEQVIMNLSINARDAMPQGGRLIIETANVDLDKDYADQHIAVKPGRFVMLSVTDTGTGMDETSKAHIFEPFFTTKEKGKGTGLGLATVYGIVKQSGGSIWAYSEPGRGTTFKVYLPRVDAPAADVKQRPTPRVSTGSETVLIVEDEDAVRRLAERILRSAGYKILSAASGGDALVLCEKHSGTIDLLLTDVVMPQMSGRELADRLTMARQGLKVLYMSGYTDNAIIHHGVLDPGIRFVGKPFSAAELTRKVREALEEGKATGE